jgi:hypothetical protein
MSNEIAHFCERVVWEAKYVVVKRYIWSLFFLKKKNDWYTNFKGPDNERNILVIGNISMQMTSAWYQLNLEYIMLADQLFQFNQGMFLSKINLDLNIF